MPITAPPSVLLTTAMQPIHTCPAGVSQTISYPVNNKSLTAAATVTLEWKDANNGNAVASLLTQDVPFKDGINPAPITLDPGDVLQGMASANGQLTCKPQVLLEVPFP